MISILSAYFLSVWQLWAIQKLRQETKWKATGEPELVNYVVMGIPTNPGKRAVWLCLHTVFKIASVFMDTWGAAPRQLDAGQGATASAVALAGAKPRQTQLLLVLALVHNWCAGGSPKTSGLEKSGKGDRLGLQSLLDLSLRVKGWRLLASLPDSVEMFPQDQFGQRAPAIWWRAISGMSSLWETWAAWP